MAFAIGRFESLEDYLVRAKLQPMDRKIEATRGTHKCTSNTEM